ncbi:MAG: transposase [Deltaproteobacteria bacterium]|nr:transposase [Deltaproteobacteria bacterium]
MAKEYYSADEIAATVKISRRAINARAKKESWAFREETGLGGKKRHYAFSGLPEMIKLALVKEEEPSNVVPINRYINIERASKGVPARLSSPPSTKGAGGAVLPMRRPAKSADGSTSLTTGGPADPPAPPPTLSTSSRPAGRIILPPSPQNQPWAEKIALARADLVRDFCTYRETARRRGEKLTDASRDFLAGYASGLILPGLRETLGDVSLATLYNWEKLYRESGYDYMTMIPHWGRHRAGISVITEEEQQVLLTICLHPNRINMGTAVRLAKHLLENRGLPSPSSPDTMRRYLEKYKSTNFDRWTLARGGEKALIDRVVPYIERDDSLLNVGDVLVGDGHRCNFMVVNPFTGKPCRPSLLGFFDWASRMMVGWSIMLEENVQAVAAALRSAIIHLSMIPKFLLLDNGKAFKAKVFTDKVDLFECGISGLFARLGIETVFAWPYIARSKPIERFFETLSNTFERLLPSFCGSSINDKPAPMRRNEAYMQAVFGGRIPQIPEINEYLHSWQVFYGNMEHPTRKGKTRAEVFAAGRGPGVEDAGLTYLMMAMKVRTIGRNGVRFLGRHYWNENLYGLRDRAVIRYDWSNLSYVYVSDTEGRDLGRADRVARMDPMVRLTEPMDDSYSALREQQKLQKRLVRETKQITKLAVGHGEREKLDALPWDEMLQIEPRLPEIVEQAEAEALAELAAPAENHSEEILEMVEPETEPTEIGERPKEQPWEYCFERYQWLMDQAPETLTDEQRAWMEEYKSGRLEPGEFELIFGQKAKAGDLDE